MSSDSGKMSESKTIVSKDTLAQQQARAEKRAAALRENLKRRKQKQQDLDHGKNQR